MKPVGDDRLCFSPYKFMQKYELTPRLALCARFAAGASCLVDVGTDHGYLPINLLLGGKIERAVAADIRPGPLSSARRHAAEALCEDKMRFECCDGLDFAGAELCDAVVCAGMGGETIMGILSRAPWTKLGVRLILQPQSKLDELCLWLRENGYGIFDAALAAEGRRMYVALLCRAGESQYLYAEEALAAAGDTLLPAWAGGRIARINKAVKGMLKSSSSDAELDAARRTAARLEQYVDLDTEG